MQLDIKKIREYTGSEDDFIVMLMDKYLSHADEDLQELDDYKEQEEWKKVQEKTHAMLSSARIFHLDEIIKLSDGIEEQCRAGNTDGLTEKVNRLIKLYKEASIEMKSLKEKINTN